MGFLKTALYLADVQRRVENDAILRARLEEFTNKLQQQVTPIRCEFELVDIGLKISATYRKYGYQKIIEFVTITDIDINALIEVEARNIREKFLEIVM